jgi:hypothetical protein
MYHLLLPLLPLLLLFLLLLLLLLLRQLAYQVTGNLHSPTQMASAP